MKFTKFEPFKNVLNLFVICTCLAVCLPKISLCVLAVNLIFFPS